MKEQVRLLNKKDLTVKICGMRDPENVLEVRQLPIHLMGFIFYEPSQRYVEKEGKPEINFKMLTQWGIKRVGVFVDAEIDYVLKKREEYQLDYVQLHGKENLFYCRRLKDEGCRIIKAFAVDDQFDFKSTRGYELFSDYFLFDTKGVLPGGNGVAFDWELLEGYTGETPFLVGGGVGPGMENQIVQFDHPKFAGIDLNSKFEIRPGLKDHQLIREFLNTIFELQL